MNGTAMVSSGRYVATNLADVIAAQGRRRNWLAARVGVSEALLYKVVLGTKTADRALGERIAVALGVPFGVLFEIRERNDLTSLPEEPA